VSLLSAEFETYAPETPRELAALLASAGGVLGNDSGPSHLAALLGTPVVVLFGPSDARVWRPVGAGVRVLAGPHPAAADWELRPDPVSEACWRHFGRWL
jgi:ADP-heptose:LPS heptosyltransferase